MPVARKVPILSHLLAAPAQPTQLADSLANSLIDQYARTDVATLSTIAEKTSNGYSSSVARSPLLTSTHINYEATFLNSSHPRKLMPTYGTFNVVRICCRTIWRCTIVSCANDQIQRTLS